MFSGRRIHVTTIKLWLLQPSYVIQNQFKRSLKLIWYLLSYEDVAMVNSNIYTLNFANVVRHSFIINTLKASEIRKFWSRRKISHIRALFSEHLYVDQLNTSYVFLLFFDRSKKASFCKQKWKKNCEAQKTRYKWKQQVQKCLLLFFYFE